MIRKIKIYLVVFFEMLIDGFKHLLNNKLRFYQHVILLNIIVYVVSQFVLPVDVVKHFMGYSFQSENFEIWQPLTSMFMHSGFWHIFINMFIFWSVADMFEKMMSKTQFITLYFAAGLIGYLLQSILADPNVPMIGASGAIFGFLGAAIILIPNQKFYVIFFPFIGFKAKWLISIALLLELVLGIVNVNTGIGHLCHFGGGITGLLIAGFWITKKIPHFILRNKHV